MKLYLTDTFFFVFIFYLGTKSSDCLATPGSGMPEIKHESVVYKANILNSVLQALLVTFIWPIIQHNRIDLKKLQFDNLYIHLKIQFETKNSVESTEDLTFKKTK